jgi:Tol biopolymer transport system component
VLRGLLGVLLLLAVPAMPAGAHTTFPGANGKIAFLETEYYDRSAIHVINPDGTDDTSLTSNQASNQAPAWSPDGRRIAFTSDGDGRDNSYDVYTINADNGERTRLTSTGNASSVSWSPDGNKIAFADYDIYTVNADGTGLRTVSDAGRSWDPAWSPNGRQIAFVGIGDGHQEIFKVNADGTEQTRLTTTTSGRSGLDYIDPTWSPDGTKIAFTTNRDTGCQLRSCYRIYVMNADGSQPTRLTSYTGGSWHPVWSPDATEIAFINVRDGTYEIYVMKADGTGQRRLTNNDVDDFNHVWSPDGTKIAIERDPGATALNRLYVVDVDDGSERFLASGARPDWGRLRVNAPPICTGVVATPSVLWPPNHSFRLVGLAGGTDPDGDEVAITIDDVRQDEPLTSRHDRTSPDAALGARSDQVQLRAERSPRGDGRVYRIDFTASDGNGGSCSGTVTVTVTRHKRQDAVDSAPPSYSSFG